MVNISENDKTTMPLISVVISVLNAADTLQRCIDSVTNQTYICKEIIIIDGGSTDGSVDILKANDNKIAYWKSEPDHGIYHAWNKSILLAHGKYICFLGADDLFADISSLEILAQAAVNNQFPDFISGKVAMVNKNNTTERILGEAWNSDRMKKWMIVAHPGMLHHKDVFKSFGMFSEKYKIAGDYDFLLRCNEKTTHVFIDAVLVCMGNGGASSKNKRKVFYETFVVQSMRKDIGLIKSCANYCIAWLKFIVRNAARIIASIQKNTIEIFHERN